MTLQITNYKENGKFYFDHIPKKRYRNVMQIRTLPINRDTLFLIDVFPIDGLNFVYPNFSPKKIICAKFQSSIGKTSMRKRVSLFIGSVPICITLRYHISKLKF